MSKRAEIMLCYPLEERRLMEKKFGWVWPVICQPKLDGERARAVNEWENQIDLLSSECNDVTGVPHINYLLECVRRILKDKGINLPETDGELYSHGKRFEEIHSIVSRSMNNLHPEMLSISYHIFDTITEEPQYQRLFWLSDVLAPYIEGTSIKIVPFKLACDMTDLMDHYKGYLDEGYEGIIVRHPFSNYVRKRSTFILKFKPKKEDTYEIIGVYEAIAKDGTPKGMIGGFNCTSNEGTKFEVGAGNLTHKQRYFYWHHPEEAIGKDCLVQYQNINSKSGKPRFGLCVEVI